MLRYKTEVIIPPDRYISLQLPEELPEGHAIVTVVFQPNPASSQAAAPEDNPENQDIEWWEEFEGDCERIA